MLSYYYSVKPDDILFLHKYPQSPISKLVVLAKIFIKEGILLNNWKSVFSRRDRGGSVTLPKSIQVGFKQKKILFVENCFSSPPLQKTVYVAKDVRCLEWALEQHKRGHINRLVVGPLIVNLPEERSRIIENPLIDVVLLPSQWFVNFFKNTGLRKETNYQVWSLGVDSDFWSTSPLKPSYFRVLVYVKNPPKVVLRSVLTRLSELNIPYDVVTTGSFTQDEYKKYLHQSQAVIFLSQTETQGLAMFEAWSCDVPTFHWNCGKMKFGNVEFSPASSCPYLTDICGMHFSSETDFKDKFDIFISKISSYRPRNFILSHHTISMSIDRLMSFLE